MGAMRLPLTHAPTLDLVAYVNEQIVEKNKGLEEQHPTVSILEYYFDSRDASHLSDLN